LALTLNAPSEGGPPNPRGAFCVQNSKPSVDAVDALHLLPHMTLPSFRFVYILRSVSEPERHYVGLTDDVSARMTAHNQQGTSHTSKYQPWKLVVALEFSCADGAIRFEKYLKSGSGRAFAKRHFGPG
jgi:putative endonuclease